MKDLVPTPPPPPIIQNRHSEIRDLFHRYVMPSYDRFDLVLSHGAGSYVWDVSGKRYLDLGGGIAVCSLGHSNPEITEAIIEQSRRLVHVSNLYYQEPQGRLAMALTQRIAPGKVFFCNSGAEANEGLYKVARKFGHDSGRFEILTAFNSFHGRTLGGISATGQEKVKKGFEPIIPGFRHIPFNDLQAAHDALSPATAAILIEGIQGEGGITPATPKYLLGLRRFCNEKGLLLFIDAVQCGHFRSGRFQSYQRILEGVPGGESFIPDGLSMAKSLGGGFPMGAFWLREAVHGVNLADSLSAGTHGTTFGGMPLGCAVALKILEVIERDSLADHVRATGDWLQSAIQNLANRFPSVVRAPRGLGFMLGIELQEADQVPSFSTSQTPPSLQVVHRLHEAGVLTIPSGNQIVRLLPALNLPRAQAEEGITLITKVIQSFA